MSIIGNAALIILICYVLASVSTKQKVTLSDVLCNGVVLVVLHVLLLR